MKKLGKKFFYSKYILYITVSKLNDMQTQIEKEYEVKFSENWYGSLEYAYIDITTKKGTTLRIDKWEPAKFQFKWSENEECTKLVWDVYKRILEAKKNNQKNIKVTKNEILLLAQYSQHQTSEIKTKKIQK